MTLESIVKSVKRNVPSIVISLSSLVFTVAYETAGESNNTIKDAMIYAVPFAGAIMGYYLALERGLRKKLEQETIIDQLVSNVYNKAHFETYLPQIADRVRRENSRGVESEAYLLLIDLDYFKHINDLLGHQKGDEVLKEIGKYLAAAARRSTDEVFRIGGDEFAIVLNATQKSGADIVKNRVMHSINEYSGTLSEDMARAARRKGTKFSPLSASIGIASFLEGNHEPSGIIQIADDRMYAEKQMNHQTF